MRALARYFLSQDGGGFTLSLIAQLCVPVALRGAAPDAWLSLLVPVVVTGTLVGHTIFNPRWQGGRWNTVWLAGGAAVLFLRIGHIGGALIRSVEAGVRLLPGLVISPPLPGIQIEAISAWLAAQIGLADEVAAFGQRAATWLIDSARGNYYEDPAARALFLSLSVWLLAGWAAWRIGQKRDPLGGLLPTTLALALALNATVQDRWPLWVHLAAFLALIALSHLAWLAAAWEARRTDYSDSAVDDSAQGAVLLIILVLIAAFTTSSFSIREWMDKLRAREEPAAANALRPGNGSSPASRRPASGAETRLHETHYIEGAPRLSQDVVMIIITGELPPAQHAVESPVPRYYWRSITYQNYIGSGWNNPTRVEEEVPAHAALIAGTPARYRRMHASVMPGPGSEGSIHWAGALIALNRPFRVVWRARPAEGREDAAEGPLNGADMVGAYLSGDAAGGQQYQFDSWVPMASEGTLEGAPARYSEWIRQQYLQLPGDLPERVRVLGRDLTAHERTPYDRALAIEEYLRGFPYDPDAPAPPAGSDAADYFLFTLKRGYCDYYATAMAVLARAAGLPARMVVGYASGHYDVYSAAYIVRKADAHSWTEIYFPGSGWIEFEPTASQPAPAREAGHMQSNAPEEKARVLGAPNLLPELGAADPKWLWILLTAPAALWLAWLGIDLIHLRSADPAEVACRLYWRLRRSTKWLAGPSHAGQTALEYCASLSDRLGTPGRGWPLSSLMAPVPGLAGNLTDLYLQCLFSPTPLSSRDRQRAIRTWTSLRGRLGVLRLLMGLSRLAMLRRSAPSSPRNWQAG